MLHTSAWAVALEREDCLDGTSGKALSPKPRTQILNLLDKKRCLYRTAQRSNSFQKSSSASSCAGSKYQVFRSLNIFQCVTKYRNICNGNFLKAIAAKRNRTRSRGAWIVCTRGANLTIGHVRSGDFMDALGFQPMLNPITQARHLSRNSFRDCEVTKASFSYNAESLSSFPVLH